MGTTTNLYNLAQVVCRVENPIHWINPVRSKNYYAFKTLIRWISNESAFKQPSPAIRLKTR